LEYSLHSALHSLGHAWGDPPARGRLRASPEDFRVTEIPLLEPDGEGEHAWLWVRKRGVNTAWVAGQLARHAGVPAKAVSYAGMKDRNALTEQWFSVHLPGKAEPDWARLDVAGIEVIRHARHGRKLRRGALKGNLFRLCLRDVDGDRDVMEQRLQLLAIEGVPNYYGEQRFGRDGRNLQVAGRLLGGQPMRIQRLQRGLALSAARSFLFNQVLSRRVADNTWHRLLQGDVLQLDGTHSFFVAEIPDRTLLQRVEMKDVHPTGPLCGKGASPATARCLQLEEAALSPYPTWRTGLAQAGLEQARRALRLVVNGLEWQWCNTGHDLVLEFSLPPGAYATSVLREFMQQ